MKLRAKGCLREAAHSGPLLWVVGVTLGASLWWLGGAGGPSSGPFALAHPLPQDTATPQPLVFLPRIVVTPLDGPPHEPIDVIGYVVDRLGRPVVGAQVRVSSSGWEAYAATGGGGTFRFTLTRGEFSIVLADRPSRPALIRVDGTSNIQVVFQEGSTPSTTPTPPASPTATPSPAPTLTPILEVGRPVIIAPSATGTPIPVSGVTVTPLSPSTFEVSWDPWANAFLRGAAAGGGVVLLGLLVVLLRRGGQG